MAYATLSHVEALDAGLTFTEVSRPDVSAVVEFLEQTAAEIDGLLAAKDYLVPVSATAATTSYRLVQRWNAIGGNALAQRAAPNSPNVEAAEKAWGEVLKLIASGKTILPDAPKDSGTSRLRIRTSATNAGSRMFNLSDQL